MSVSQQRDLAVLDNPAWHSLAGVHAHLAEGTGLARRYRADVSPFHAIADAEDPQAWRDLAALVGAGGVALITGSDITPPPEWLLIESIPGVQLVETEDVEPATYDDLELLGQEDAAEMLELVGRTKPGPFLDSTYLMGTYLGVRHQGRLVAMAGQRMQPDGWVEISAVCTDADHRGKGHASRLVRAVTADIHSSGRRALLHASASNTGAIDVYLRLGFELRKRPDFKILQAPA